MTPLEYSRLLKPIKHVLLISMMLAACEEPENRTTGVHFSNVHLSVSEGNIISARLVFNAATTRDGSLQLSIQTDAIYGQHYTTSPAVNAGSLTLNVSKGNRGVQFSITALDNNTIDAPLSLVFTINSSSGGFTPLSPARLSVYIDDDEATIPHYQSPPTMISFATAKGTISESESEGLPITVYLTKFGDDGNGSGVQPTTTGGDVLVKLASGHASYGKEFTTSPAATQNSILLKFTGTQTDTTFTVIPMANSKFTGSRFISVSLLPLSGDIQAGSIPKYWIEITDDESGPDKVTWTKLNSPVNTDIQSAVFHSENSGYIVTNDKIRKTIDGGQHWTEMNPDPLKDYQQVNLDFLTEDVGFLTGAEYTCYDYEDCMVSTKIFTTTDGGTSWSVVKEFNTTMEITSLFFISQSTGFIGTEAGEIMKTVDAGKTWISVSTLRLNAIHDITIFDNGVGYARIGDRIIKTSDSGNSWNTSFITLENSEITSLAFSSTRSLYATWQECQDLPSGFSTIHKSEDGSSWSSVGECTMTDKVSFSSNSTLGASIGKTYWGRWSSSIHLSQDTGQSWNWLKLPSDDIALYDVEVASDKVIYAVGSNGLILKGVVQ